MAHRNVVVIGGSLGGIEAARTILAGLPADLAASVFIVIHTSPNSPGLMDRVLSRDATLPVVYANDGDPFIDGHVYIARPDCHLVLEATHMRLTRGPRENRFRPAVDPLFRRAALAHGPRAIGVVLSGGQDDGAVGLAYIKHHGGIALVQAPDDALAVGMPEAAIRHVNVDGVMPAADLAREIARVVAQPLPEDDRMPTDPPRDVAERGAHDIHNPNPGGTPAPYVCPECGGALRETHEGDLLQYRCHVGHRYSGDSLLTAQNEQLDQALWSALRALEESAALRQRMAAHAHGRGMTRIADESRRGRASSARRSSGVSSCRNRPRIHRWM